MITYLKRTLKDRGIRRHSYFEIGTWINVIDPTEKEIELLVKKFNLDKQNLISGLDQNEIPRLDFVKGNTYIFLKTMSSTKKSLQTYLIVLAEKFFLTLSKEEPRFIKKLTQEEFITTQKLKCMIRLFSEINKEFERSTIEIVRTVNLKKSHATKLKDKDVAVLLEQEDILNNFVFSYYYINLVYERLIKKIKFFEKDKEIIEDLIIGSKEGFNLCKSSLKTISNIRNYYTILLSNKLNRIITILTVFTIFISIPAAISGIYGMNLVLPLEKNPFAFYYILLFIGVLWLILLLYFKKKDII